MPPAKLNHKNVVRACFVIYCLIRILQGEFEAAIDVIFAVAEWGLGAR